jgi:hypothetical protein
MSSGQVGFAFVFCCCCFVVLLFCLGALGATADGSKAYELTNELKFRNALYWNGMEWNGMEWNGMELYG